MTDTPSRAQRPPFMTFYREVFLEEHTRPANVLAHMFGTFLGLAWLAASLVVGPIYWAIAFPVVHALPGLIGHRVFERNAAVGDVRITRKDYPNAWFVLGNHLMTLEVLLGRVPLGRAGAVNDARRESKR
jgi:hypothetical protein